MVLKKISTIVESTFASSADNPISNKATQLPGQMLALTM
jgi:hypothetical protein